ncbi:hypothetical protein [Streptomyces sp. NPDC058677]|uniref:hypothetical protein n=1 Tax=Streptomyces sp. NPDC058677 TaxID=3346594 RepID=UPI003660127A
MESTSYRYGDNARQGGMDIVLSLTPDEVTALGIEGASELADWFDSALYALALLRNGHSSRPTGEKRDITKADLQILVTDLDKNLLPRLQGIRDAVIRLHKHNGGSLNDLATAMDVPKSTAQSRRNAVTNTPVANWEAWAISGGPQDRANCQACGWPATPSDPLVMTVDGFTIHEGHVTDPDHGFHRAELVTDNDLPDGIDMSDDDQH